MQNFEILLHAEDHLKIDSCCNSDVRDMMSPLSFIYSMIITSCSNSAYSTKMDLQSPEIRESK